MPPVEHLHHGHPVRQGWQAGQAVFGPRILRRTLKVRQWLQLRLNAWLRGRAFAGVQVTPQFLAQIDVPVYPITREALSHCSLTASNASVDRVCNRAGYAAGNLAVMSVRANQAKPDHDWAAAMRCVKQIATEGYAAPRPGWARAKPPFETAPNAPTIAAWPHRTSMSSSSVPASPARR